jgi:hypothetical protein
MIRDSLSKSHHRRGAGELGEGTWSNDPVATFQIRMVASHDPERRSSLERDRARAREIRSSEESTREKWGEDVISPVFIIPVQSSDIRSVTMLEWQGKEDPRRRGYLRVSL